MDVACKIEQQEQEKERTKRFKTINNTCRPNPHFFDLEEGSHRKNRVKMHHVSYKIYCATHTILSNNTFRTLPYLEQGTSLQR